MHGSPSRSVVGFRCSATTHALLVGFASSVVRRVRLLRGVLPCAAWRGTYLGGVSVGVPLSPADDIAKSIGGASSRPKDSHAPPVINLNIGKAPIQGVVGLSVKTILRGRILDAKGRPAPHARVSFHVDQSTREAVAEATTDAEGRFETKVDAAGKLIARVGSTIEAKVVAVRGQVTDVGDLVPDTK